MKKTIAFLIIALLALPLISCVAIDLDRGIPASTDIVDETHAPEERDLINWDNILDEGQLNPLIELGFMDSQAYWGRAMIGLSAYFPKELLETFDLKPAEGADYIEFRFEYRLYDDNGDLMKRGECGTFVHDGSVRLGGGDESFLRYVYDLTKSGVYALVAYTEYYDSESETNIGLRSAPLFFDISIETDDSHVELTAEESRNGVMYALKGDIHFDSIYGFRPYTDDDFRPLHLITPGENGELINSMAPGITESADIHRFYDFLFNDDTARFRMTLPVSLKVNVIDNNGGPDNIGILRAPAEDAYMAVFTEFYPRSWLTGTEREAVYYVSVDLDGVLHENPGLIKLQIEQYLKDTGIILLWENMDSLIEQGYIIADDNGSPVYFENGSLFYFNDEVLTDVMYQASPYKWFGNLGAEGATYKVEIRSGTWEVTSITGMWIS